MASQAVLEIHQEAGEVHVVVVQIPDTVDEETESMGVAMTRRGALGAAWLLVKHSARV